MPRRRSCKNLRKHHTAPSTREVLFCSHIVHRAGAVEHKVTMRRLAGRLAAEVSALGRKLNPKLHATESQKLLARIRYAPR